eukprot:TRINITY_DN33286_c0_g1_i1.p1 TRINITY_DN33286_c0_g1~~TRINITY_DN33286_c0_g1_i1.p1  ORF type:complete len:230 (+),score=29.59 TRINITY_DN33286_c0_g1_i1:64-690(+)
MPENPVILCFGDSLTAGYHHHGTAFHPYKESLVDTLGNGVTAEAIGFSGWRTGEMVSKADSPKATDVCDMEWPGLRHALKQQQYTHCIIMGGTNDLADMVPADTLFGNLMKLHQMCHSAGVKTVALPIPPSKWLTPSLEQPYKIREEVNQRLKEWATTEEKAVWVDMTQYIPYSAESGHWEPDGLHMSKEGYVHFGKKLADELKTIIQ